MIELLPFHTMSTSQKSTTLYPRSKLFREHEQAKLNKQKPFPRSRLFRSESKWISISVSDLFSLTEQMKTTTIDRVKHVSKPKPVDRDMTEGEKFWYQVNNRKGNEWYDEE